MPGSHQIVVDWGSSSFRAFLLGQNFEVLETARSDDGVISLQGRCFYSVLMDHCDRWIKHYGKMPIVLGGTIGSRNGWRQTPYLPCPASTYDIKQHMLSVDNESDLDIRILPGVQAQNAYGNRDVMRGEEVQIFGALDIIGAENAAVCLPGTHSKWCSAAQGKITSITTYLTGELFAVLRDHSSVGLVMLGAEFDEQSFCCGLDAAALAEPVLQQLFAVRAASLVDQPLAADNASYVSGLLIGHEVNSIAQIGAVDSPLIVVGSDTLNARYQLAFSRRQVETTVVPADAAFLRGMQLILSS